jgi:hypothetical protein
LLLPASSHPEVQDSGNWAGACRACGAQALVAAYRTRSRFEKSRPRGLANSDALTGDSLVCKTFQSSIEDSGSGINAQVRPAVMDLSIDLHPTVPWSRTPIPPAARITIGSGIFLVAIRTASVTTPISTVGTSTRERRARMYAAPAIAPTAAAVTPCTKALTCRSVQNGGSRAHRRKR